MDKLQLPHAKLFYFSAELYKNQTISESEKLKLKEYVINDEPQVFELLERYQGSNNEKDFVNGLLALLRPHQRHLYQQSPQPVVEQQRQQVAQPPHKAQPTNGLANTNGSQGFRIQMQQPQQQQQQLAQAEFFTDDNPSASQQEKINSHNEEIAQFIEKHPDCPDEISSPLGLKLLKRKQNHKKPNPQIKDYLKPYKIDQD